MTETPSTDARRARIGQMVANYRIVDVVGEGGMGIVFRAEDQRLGRTVALKFLPPSTTRDEGARARFLNEARAASALDHRNVCLIYDIAETADGELYIIMPYYSGESLQRRIRRRGALAPGETVDILLQVCAGLAKAHEKGILHRDLKPANVLVTEDAEVKILDFGAAKLADVTRLTRSGSVVGTLLYMAPEQLRDEATDVRTEIWSIGVMAYEMVTGDLPFRGETQGAVAAAILHRQPDLAALRRAAGPALAEVIRRCLRRWPQDRYPTVSDLARDLARVRRDLASAAAAPGGAAPRARGDSVLDLEPTQAYLTPAQRTAETAFEGDPGPPSSSSLTASRPVPLVVARESELQTLETWLASAAEGRGRVGLVRGEEGRGKSTLVGELCRRAAADGRFIFAIGSCNAQSGASDPYLPFRELLSQLAGELRNNEAAGEQTQAHVRRVQGLAPLVASAIVSRGPHLVGAFVSGEELLERGRELSEPGAEWIERLEKIIAGGRRDAERAELFDEYARVLQRIAAQQPLLLVVEDLHWADGGSAALFGHLAKSLGAVPVLLVGTYRHDEITGLPGGERHPFEPVVHELVRTFGDVEIDLDRSDGERFVAALIDAEPNSLGADFRTRLLRCTSGLPLFTTELLRELRDGGVLARDEAGRWTVAGDVDWDLLPRRVEVVVAERIGRLPENLRSILTAASVQGEEASAESVARVLGLDERETVRQLSTEGARRYRVVTAAGVRHVGGQRQSLYRFRHAQFQKYLYESLDEVERAMLHEDTAREMEATYSGREEEVVAQLAHHYRQARILDKAIDYLKRAATRAAHLSAHAEAVRLFEAALSELALTPEGRDRMQRELELRMSLAAVQIAVHGFGSAAVEASYLRARELCERLPNASDFPLLWGLFAFSAVRGEFDRSLPLARRMLEACDPGDPLQRIQSHYAVGVTEFFLGHFQAALEHLDAACAARQPELSQPLSEVYSQDSRKVAAAYASWVRWLRGDAEAALTAARAAVAWARQDVHPFTLSTVLLLTGFQHVLAGDGETARSHGEEMERLSREFGLFQTAEAALVQGLAGLARSAADKQATGRLASALAEYRQRQWTVFVPFLLGLLARARWEAGEESEAAALLADAWSIAEAGGERFWAAELLRLRSDLASSPEAAAATANRARARAHEQGAGWLELRAAIAVARRSGDTAPLSSAVARFPADLELEDLRAARELLASRG
jgi:serine/threonine protein kinase